MDLKLLSQASHILAPHPVPERHLLLGDAKVLGLLSQEQADALIDNSSLLGIEVIDCTGCIVVPGFVDCHVHVLGGGGEAGPASRYV